jgi:hypothetical protein
MNNDSLDTWKCGHISHGCTVCIERRVDDLTHTLEAARGFIIKRHGIVLAVTQIDEVLYKEEWAIRLESPLTQDESPSYTSAAPRTNERA